jgi:membrane associated rhomboid family serine protease
MDRASEGLRLDGSPYLPPGFDPATMPLDRTTAVAVIRRADELMEASEPEQALTLYSRAAAMPDKDVAAAGIYGAGNALYRMDRDAEALQAWERVTAMGETPVTYRAWRQVAAARVRGHDLNGAIEAYRQSERRAPAGDKAEIQSRLGWLSKETGNTGAAGRYFARSRGDALPSVMTYLIIAVTVVTSLAAQGGHVICGGFVFTGGQLELQLELDKILVAHGELYRLLSVTLVHDPSDILHLLFNMYALWYAGQLVERMYGSRLLVLFYVLGGIAASIGSYVLGPDAHAVGASGAIFALFGVVLVATRYHHAVLDAQSRAIASQVGLLIVLNLFFGFSGVFGNVDNFAHLGGLAAGLWLALIIPPGRVPTLASLWQSPQGGSGRLTSVGLPILGVGALVAVLVMGFLVGTATWSDRFEPPCRAALTVPAPASQPAGPAVVAVASGSAAVGGGR